MFEGIQICSNCKVGEKSYMLDKSSDACPHIGCLKNGKCPRYMPIDRYCNSSAEQNKLRQIM